MLLINLTENENLIGVTLLTDTGFARFLYVLLFSVKNFNGFKLKSPILDVWWFQNSQLTKKNEKKAVVVSIKLALNTQLVFTCSNAGIETLEQVVKYVQSFNTLFWSFHCWLRKSECSLGSLNFRTEFISKRNSSSALNWLLISFVKVATERFTKHFS